MGGGERLFIQNPITLREVQDETELLRQGSMIHISVVNIFSPSFPQYEVGSGEKELSFNKS